jgi:Ser/Thr protein kinase RdoA (MazF antagonist)
VRDREVQLHGGRPSSGIVRVGDTVRRPLHRNSEFVHALLRHFAATGFDGAPRLLGIDAEGREILGFVEGQVVVGPAEVGEPVEILSDAQLASAGRLMRRFHDATAGTPFAGDAEVVCHNDLGQHNIVFQGERAVAIIDWDEDVAPGPRLSDVSHAVWCLAEIGRQGGPVADQARRVNIVCDSYGWEDRRALIDAIERRFRRALAEAERDGRSAGVRIWLAMLQWIEAHGPALKAQLQPPSR